MDDNIKILFGKMSKELCTGCEACVNICPKDCISMHPDEEGFYYPYINDSICIKCGSCLKVCPVLDTASKTDVLECYGGYANDKTTVAASSSGGIFSLLVEAFYSKISRDDGYVCGVVWNNDFSKTKHIISNNANIISDMRGSKYIQSYKGYIYRQIKTILDKEKYVLFTGTPCECAALKKYLKKEYENLFIVDIICKGPTSPQAMSNFTKRMTGKRKRKILYINMRFKKRRFWNIPWLRMDFNKGRIYCKPFYETPIGKSMEIMQRLSCYECKFRKTGRVSDITIGDFHGIDPNSKCYNPLGTSAVIINTQKGKVLFDTINDACKGSFEKVTYDSIAINNPMLNKSYEKHPNREEFGYIFSTKGLENAVKKTMTTREKLRIKIPYRIREKIHNFRNL